MKKGVSYMNVGHFKDKNPLAGCKRQIQKEHCVSVPHTLNVYIILNKLLYAELGTDPIVRNSQSIILLLNFISKLFLFRRSFCIISYLNIFPHVCTWSLQLHILVYIINIMFSISFNQLLFTIFQNNIAVITSSAYSIFWLGFLFLG